METCRYVAEPGMIRDMYTIYSYHYDTEMFLNRALVGSTSMRSRDSREYAKGMGHFAKYVTKDLDVFFAVPSKTSFMSTYYADFATIEEVFQTLGNTELLRYRMYEYYLPDTGGERSLERLIDQVSHSAWSDRLKFQIMHFFTNTNHYVEVLIQSMKAMWAQVKAYYEKHMNRLEEIQSAMNHHELVEFLAIGMRTSVSENISKWDVFTYTLCLVNINIIDIRLDTRIVVLGVNYNALLPELRSQGKDPTLLRFGEACDTLKRVQILDYLNAVGQASIREIMDNVGDGVSDTGMYYHLNGLSKGGVIRVARQDNRTLYYEINCDFISEVIEALKSIS